MRTFLTALLLIAAQPASAETIYRATTTLNGHVFQDLIVFAQLPVAGDDLKGTLTVPGVFTAPFSGHANFVGSALLKLTAREGDKEFPVEYRLQILDRGERLLGGVSFPGTTDTGQVDARKIFEE